MLGVIVNSLAVILGSIVGVLFKKGISKKITDSVMIVLGLCTIYIGISGALKGENTLVLIVSMVVGAVIGELIDIDKQLNLFGELVNSRFKSSNNTVSISEGFVTGTLLFCVGAMAIVGSLNAGLVGDNELLFTKSLLDFIGAAMLSVSLGIGILFSSVSVFLVQGSIVLLANYLQPILNDAIVAEITCTGSILLIAIGFNIIGFSKFKVANYIPAIILTPVIYLLIAMI